MRKKVFYIFIFLNLILSQDDIRYQTPPKEILELVDVSLPPRVLLDENKRFMIYLYRANYKSINELSDPEIKLGGLRLNPKTSSRSRTNYYNNVMVVNMDRPDFEAQQVKGLPKISKLANIKWSPDQTKIAMTNTTKNGV